MFRRDNSHGRPTSKKLDRSPFSRSEAKRSFSTLRGLELLEDRTVLSSTPLGIEQLINTTVTGDQKLIAIASNPLATQTVQVWASAGEDGSGDGIYAQRYNQFGEKVGNAFRVNSVTSGNQTSPSAAMDSLGNFVVTWQSANQDGSGDGIYARRYGYDAVALGAEFRVNTSTSGNQQAPVIAMDGDGDFAIAFQSATRDGNGNAIVARLYRSTGTAVGNDFQVNQFTTGNQQTPAIAMDSAGNFIVAWQSVGQDSNGDAVVARRYDLNGAARGNEFIVNQFTTGNQNTPSVAAQFDGSFVVAWQSAGQDGSGDSIVARRYDTNGVAAANEFSVNQYTSGSQAAPAIAADGIGNFVISWQSAGQDGSSDAVVARTYDSTGSATESEFVVNSFTTGAQNAPAVAVDSNGDFLVSWQSAAQEAGGGTSLGIFARRLSTANDAPVLKQIANQAIDLGGSVTFTATARDEDSPVDTLTYSLTASAPIGATIDPNTGLFQWTPGLDVAAGRYFVTVEVKDSSNVVDSKVVPITIFAPGERTPLDDYVNTITPEYKWDIRSRTIGTGYVKYNMQVTSGLWRSASEVDKPLWQHWVAIYVPNVITNSRAFLFIDGGNNSTNPPAGTDLDTYAGPIAAQTGTVFVDLFSIPSQPLLFAGETSTRSEDSIIAYSWAKYLATGDATWIANLPMTRGAMRTMDAVMDFLGSPVGGNFDIESFVVAGGSKRGWTTWLASAADPRVSFAVPIVADLLNMEESFAHHYAYYNGTFSAAVKDYVNAGILNINNFGKDGIDSLLSIVDPYTYKNRLTLPKYMLYASGDEFFTPDSWQFYYDALPGPKWIRYLPNSSHGISDTNLIVDALGMVFTILANADIPSYDFTQLADGTIQVTTSGTVTDAKLWQATNTSARDFRWPVIGAGFTSTQLTDQGGGVFLGNVAQPANGWRAYFVQITMNSSIGSSVTVTSGLYIKGTPVNVQPTIPPIDDVTVVEGTPLILPINATDSDSSQTLIYSLDPGAPPQVSINPLTGVITGLWTDQVAGPLSVTVMVADNGTPVMPNRQTFLINVVNAAPVASLVGPSSTGRGRTNTFTLLANDPSPIDQAAGFDFGIDWDGDGNVDETVSGPSGTTVSHTFDVAGFYDIKVFAIDKDGATSQIATHAFHVLAYELNEGNLTWYGTSSDDTVVFTSIDPTTIQIAESLLGGQVISTMVDVLGVTGILRAFAGSGNDTVDASPLQDQSAEIHGEDGNDVIIGGLLADTLFGDAGNDTVSGGAGNDVINGGDDDDLLMGEIELPPQGLVYGNDTIDGGNGDDMIYGDGQGGEGASDLLYGGIGKDTIIGDGAEGDPSGGDTIYGGDGDDLIRGEPDGAEGAPDQIFGEEGDDFIQTGGGSDIADGGTGNDILLGGDGAEGANDNLSGGDDRDILIGEGGTTIMQKPLGGADTLNGGNGEDIVVTGVVVNAGLSAADFIAIRAEWISGRSFADRVANISGTGSGSRDNGDAFLAIGTNVFNDKKATSTTATVDHVLGGLESDWILIDVPEDLTDDYNPTEDLLTAIESHPWPD